MKMKAIALWLTFVILVCQLQAISVRAADESTSINPFKGDIELVFTESNAKNKDVILTANQNAENLSLDFSLKFSTDINAEVKYELNYAKFALKVLKNGTALNMEESSERISVTADSLNDNWVKTNEVGDVTIVSIEKPAGKIPVADYAFQLRLNNIDASEDCGYEIRMEGKGDIPAALCEISLYSGKITTEDKELSYEVTDTKIDANGNVSKINLKINNKLNSSLSVHGFDLFYYLQLNDSGKTIEQAAADMHREIAVQNGVKVNPSPPEWITIDLVSKENPGWIKAVDVRVVPMENPLEEEIKDEAGNVTTPIIANAYLLIRLTSNNNNNASIKAGSSEDFNIDFKVSLPFVTDVHDLYYMTNKLGSDSSLSDAGEPVSSFASSIDLLSTITAKFTHAQISPIDTASVDFLPIDIGGMTDGRLKLVENGRFQAVLTLEYTSDAINMLKDFEMNHVEIEVLIPFSSAGAADFRIVKAMGNYPWVRIAKNPVTGKDKQAIIIKNVNMGNWSYEQPITLIMDIGPGPKSDDAPSIAIDEVTVMMKKKVVDGEGHVSITTENLLPVDAAGWKTAFFGSDPSRYTLKFLIVKNPLVR